MLSSAIARVNYHRHAPKHEIDEQQIDVRTNCVDRKKRTANFIAGALFLSQYYHTFIFTIYS